MHFINAKGILSFKNGMNTYRGCTHGCIYCDSRSTCYGMNHAFEDIEVKQNAPELLMSALSRKRKKCMIGTGSMCDPYMHCEETLCITQKCLEIIYDYGFGAALITKSDRVLRDIELFKKINSRAKCVIQMTLTTADDKLCSIIEPHAPTTSKRVEALMALHNEGISTVVWFTPLLPFINDTERNIRGIVDMAASAGVKRIIYFGAGLTLRDGNREYFYSALDKFFPGLKEQYIRLYSNAYEIPSKNNARLCRLFYEQCNKYGIIADNNEIFTYLNELPKHKSYTQLSFE